LRAGDVAVDKLDEVKIVCSVVVQHLGMKTHKIEITSVELFDSKA
jgi:hypothetical protein